VTDRAKLSVDGADDGKKGVIEGKERMDINGSLVRRATDQIACDMGGETVILDLKSGTYYGLDVLGARIWSLIEQPASLLSIRDAIVADYEVDDATCEQDIRMFLKQMHEAGLVEIADGADH
jgi:hypothetical protein